MKPCFPGDARRWELVKEFLILLCLCAQLLLYLLKRSLSQSTSFPTFALLILSLIPLGGSERDAVWGLAAMWVNPQEQVLPNCRNSLLKFIWLYGTPYFSETLGKKWFLIIKFTLILKHWFTYLLQVFLAHDNI